jgi:hypothetical protein
MASLILAAPDVWALHLRCGEPVLARRLEAGLVLIHPMVVGALAVERLHRRHEVLGALCALPPAVVASDCEVLDFIEREDLVGAGVGYVDAHLLAATRLTPNARLWTLDPQVTQIAGRMGTAFIAA